jgi:hypothetical protein
MQGGIYYIIILCQRKTHIKGYILMKATTENIIENSKTSKVFPKPVDIGR